MAASLEAVVAFLSRGRCGSASTAPAAPAGLFDPPPAGAAQGCALGRLRGRQSALPPPPLRSSRVDSRRRRQRDSSGLDLAPRLAASSSALHRSRAAEFELPPPPSAPRSVCASRCGERVLPKCPAAHTRLRRCHNGRCSTVSPPERGSGMGSMFVPASSATKPFWRLWRRLAPFFGTTVLPPAHKGRSGSTFESRRCPFRPPTRLLPAVAARGRRFHGQS